MSAKVSASPRLAQAEEKIEKMAQGWSHQPQPRGGRALIRERMMLSRGKELVGTFAVPE